MIDEIVRDGARRMLAAALQAEVEDYVDAFADQRDEAGRRLLVRNGNHQPREVMTTAGAVEVVAPRGDGELGFWGALREVFPATAEQRCWVHETANVLAALLIDRSSSTGLGNELA